MGDAASITIADGNEALTLPAAMEITTLSGEKKSVSSEEIKLLTGAHYMDSLENYDVVFKSPGVVLPKAADEYTCLITSQTEVFFEAYREQIIGITGTKGKSTTSTLLYHILQESGIDTVLAGNIGIPFFDILEQITPRTRIVCELSCHQLEYIHVSPHIAILLNIHEEHLDHYGTMEKYVHAKQQIYLHQKEQDLPLLQDWMVLPAKGTCPSHILTVSDRFASCDVTLTGTRIRFESGDYRIPASETVCWDITIIWISAFDYGVCHELGVDDESFTKALISYEPLPHRLRLIGSLDGVRYYDDSISTICDTAIQALKSIPSPGSILIGGMDRGIDYSELIEYLSVDSVPHIILMEATGKRIYEEIKNSYPAFHDPDRLHLVEHLSDAVELAKKVTPRGSACILSPAAASYGIFKNFEERGDAFRDLVFEL